jgi:Cu/Ag efflux pump CusA
MRLRPILMTTIAFCAGVVPLILGSGAGSEMRRAMGIAVFSGMVATLLHLLTPVFYVLLRSRREKRWCCNMRRVKRGAGSSHNPKPEGQGDSDV